MVDNPFTASFIDDEDETTPAMEFSNKTAEPEAEQPKEAPKEETHSMKPQYRIADFYWFTHSGFEKGEIPKEEAAVLIVGYNADYSNLRLELMDLGEKGGNSPGEINKTKFKHIASINIFSECAFQILAAINSKKDKSTIINRERIFSITAGWSPTPAKITIDRTKGEIYISVKYGENGVKHYILRDWQITAFIDCLKFMTNGRSWMSSLS